MIITDVLGYALSSPYGSGRSLGQPLGVKSIGLVEVHTDAGLMGIGETYAGVYAPELVEPAAAFWRPALVGKDPLDDDLSDLLQSVPFVGRSGLLSSVFSAIEIALWDIRGKAAEQPVHKLLNRAGPRERVKLYASGGSAAHDPRRITEEIGGVREAGFASFKMRVGYQDWDQDMARVSAAREALGEEGELMVDAIMGTIKPPWDLETAVARANDLTRFDLAWLEEPLHPTNLADYTRLRAATSVPIASGEALSGLLEFAEYLSAGALDIVQPDVTHCGGYEVARQVAAQAKQHGVRLALHVWGSAVALSASGHFAMACPDVEYLEVPMVSLELSDQMYTAPLKMEGGYLRAPDAPGLGVQVTPELKERYALVPGSGYRL